MTKQLIEIAKEQGADMMEESGTVNVDSGEIILENEAKLKAIFDAYNAQNSEHVGEIVCDARTGHTVNIFTGDKPYPNIGTKLYTSPQTLPPEWAEYVGRLEKALNIIVLSEEPNHVADMLSTKGMAITAKQALATKPKG